MNGHDAEHPVDDSALTYEQTIQNSRRAAYQMAKLPAAVRQTALLHMAEVLLENEELILEANRDDAQAAVQSGYTETELSATELDSTLLRQIARGVREIAASSDPLGEVIGGWTAPNGAKIVKTRAPIGTIGVLFQERPHVAVTAAALCLKSGNSVVMAGCGHSFTTSLALSRIMRQAAETCGIPSHAIQFIEDSSPETARALTRAFGLIDAIIPQGDEAWVLDIIENSLVPVIATVGSRCHLYVHEDANLDVASRLLAMSAFSEPGASNGVCRLLLHRKIAKTFAEEYLTAMAEQGLTFRACPESAKLLPMAEELTIVSELSGDPMGLDVVIVKDIDQAIQMINQSGGRSAEAIVAESAKAIDRFSNEVDAACICVNASTRLSNGYDFGFGVDAGVSTQKLHARGPLSPLDLTTHKYIVYGDGCMLE